MKIAIIINEQRSTEALRERLKGEGLAQQYNISYDLFFVKPTEIEATLLGLNHQTYNAVIVGGGDGTVRTAANALIEKEVPLVILPLGTFNLLAKTLNHPNDIDALFAMIKNNKTKQIDLAEVNGQIIINHAWIGFYYYILKMREKHKEVLGRNRLLKILFNAFHAFKLLPIYQLTFQTENKIVEYKTCLVYVSNNESYMGFFDFGERKSLTSGLLAVTILNCQTRWSLFLCMLSMLFSNAKNSKYIKQIFTDSLTINAKSNMINIVIDGELFKLDTPLNFKNHQKKLTVMIP